MSAAAPKTFEEMGSRLVAVEDQAKTFEFVVGRYAAIDAGLGTVTNRVDDKAKELAKQITDATAAMSQKLDDAKTELLEKIDETKNHAKAGAESSDATAALMRNAQNLSAVLPPGVRGVFSLVMLVLVFLASFFQLLQTLGVLHR